MDRAGQKTLFRGIVGAFVVYALGIAAGRLLPRPAGLWIEMGLILLSLAFAIGWFIAVRRGFRLGASNRQTRRAEKRRKPARPRRL